jgi:aminoglycoside 2''-phosphotransferase
MSGHHDGLDDGSIRSEIARIAPGFGREPIARLGDGMDSLAVSVGGTFVFRFAKHAEAAAGLRREVMLLPRLAPGLPLDVPRFEFVGEHSATGLPFVGYRPIPGEPLHRMVYEEQPADARDGLLGELAAFLDAVHAFPVREAAACGVEVHGDRTGYLEDLRRARARSCRSWMPDPVMPSRPGSSPSWKTTAISTAPRRCCTPTCGPSTSSSRGPRIGSPG